VKRKERDLDIRDSRVTGSQTFSGLVLALGGIFAVIASLMAVYTSPRSSPSTVRASSAT
jgi:hypothetical protein